MKQDNLNTEHFFQPSTEYLIGIQLELVQCKQNPSILPWQSNHRKREKP